MMIYGITEESRDVFWVCDAKHSDMEMEVHPLQMQESQWLHIPLQLSMSSPADPLFCDSKLQQFQ